MCTLTKSSERNPELGIISGVSTWSRAHSALMRHVYSSRPRTPAAVYYVNRVRVIMIERSVAETLFSLSRTPCQRAANHTRNNKATFHALTFWQAHARPRDANGICNCVGLLGPVSGGHCWLRFANPRRKVRASCGSVERGNGIASKCSFLFYAAADTARWPLEDARTFWKVKVDKNLV